MTGGNGFIAGRQSDAVGKNAKTSQWITTEGLATARQDKRR
jgi:hypothetical protein